MKEDLLDKWRRVPQLVSDVVDGRPDEVLAQAKGSDGLTMLELVHHLTEANIVAATMIIAAMGASGTTYDWSWLWPNKEWADRLGYSRVPAAGSIKLLDALIEHVTHVIRAAGNDALEREVRLFDTPNSDVYTKTVADIVRMEIDHAENHLRDVGRGAGADLA